MGETYARAPRERRDVARPLPDFGAAVPRLISIQGVARERLSDYEIGTVVRFAQGSADLAAFDGGWHQAEEWGRWTEARAELILKLGPDQGRREDLAFAAAFSVYDPSGQPRRVEITANGKPLLCIEVPAGDFRPRLVRCPLPKTGPLLRLAFAFPDASSTAEPGSSGGRILGGGFHFISVDRIAAPVKFVPENAVAVDLLARPADAPWSGHFDGLHPQLPLSPRSAINFAHPNAAEMVRLGSRDIDGCWLGEGPATFSLRIDEVSSCEPPGTSLALLLLFDVARGGYGSILKVEVGGQIFDQLVQPQDQPSLLLRIGPLAYRPEVSLDVTVTAEQSGPGRAVKLRLATFVGWREPLPSLARTVRLVEVLPRLGPPAAVAGVADDGDPAPLSVLLRQWSRDISAEVRRLGKAVGEPNPSQAPADRQLRETVQTGIEALMAGLELIESTLPAKPIAGESAVAGAGRRSRV